ncbi:cytochrome P450 [Bimuria novae-zelandiae CBS 107.79]|uniref:Cytochrome P450 n=1 Tax=Bimuria novae-zelandiae CBS 107.79 TaxID=1447943 RepID=A0A6A5UJD3_9PLEO|nr:cytochrome P450 [Bimuria novae-zelandiae CBS 107.79]
MTIPMLLKLFATAVTLFVGSRVYLYQSRQLNARKHGCQSAPRYKHKDPVFGLDLFLRTGDAMTKNRFLVEHQQRYDTYGRTFEALNFGSLVVYSVHPENIKAVWSKNAADWGVQPMRLHVMKPFCGVGFLTTDGSEWKLSHSLMKPGFHKSNINDFEPLEEHFQLMLEKIPKDGSTFDLQPWILKLYLDLNTLFLFGEPIGMLSQSPSPHAEGFLTAFQEGFNGCGMRFALGPLKFLFPSKGWLKACKRTHEFANVYVDRALEYRKEHLTDAMDEAPAKKRTLLYHMAQQTSDKTVLRDQIVQAMMAATETTASLISSVVHALSQNGDVFATLRAEILAIGSVELDFDSLSRLEYLQNVITETLRLYPVFPQNNRMALRDTVLPTGGGPDGTAPIFAPAGTLFDTCFATLHRDKKIWGPDADVFRPDRWAGECHPSAFEFMPFGAGPRQCLAQQKATMETSYVITRLLQEFKEIKSRDERPWQAQVALTAKNANGCLVSLTRAT